MIGRPGPTDGAGSVVGDAPAFSPSQTRPSLALGPGHPPRMRYNLHSDAWLERLEWMSSHTAHARLLAPGRVLAS